MSDVANAVEYVLDEGLSNITYPGIWEDDVLLFILNYEHFAPNRSILDLSSSWMSNMTSVGGNNNVIPMFFNNFTRNVSFPTSNEISDNREVSLSSGYLNNPAVAVPMGLSLYVLSLLTFIGNSMVLHAIRTERRLQTVSNMFIMSLAVADVTVGMIVMPISSAYAITGNWKFGIIVCQFWLSVDYTASTASILNLFILSLDRYWSIRSPLKYMRKRTKKRALIMIGIVWLVSSLWIVPIIGWHFWYNNGIRKHPSDVCETEFADNVLFKLSTSTANFYLPLVLMICLYVKIFTEIKKRSSSEIGQCNQGQERRELARDFINPSEGGIEREQNLWLKKVKWHSPGSQTPKGFEQHQETSISLQRKREFEEEETIQDTNLMPTASQLAGSEKRHSKILKMGRPYRQLTLLSVPRLNSDQEFCNKHFDNVVVNVEVTGNNGSEDKGSVFLESDKVLTCDSRSESFLSSAENLDIKQRRSGFGFRKTYGRETNHNNIGKDNIELNSMVDQLLKPRNGHFSRNRYSKNIENYVTHWDSLTRPGTSSSFRARFLPHFTAAFPLRVTKKTLGSNLRQQKKAARQLGVIMGAFIMCWLPYIIIFIVTAYCEDCIDPQIHTATIWLGYLNSTMNPFLYALCNDNFKRAFKKIFRSTSKGTNFFTASNTKRTDHRFA